MNLSKLTLKKKIAILMTSAVFVIGLAAWMIIYRAERSDSIGNSVGSALRSATKPMEANAQRPSTPRADGSTRSHANHTIASVAPSAFASALTPRTNHA